MASFETEPIEPEDPVWKGENDHLALKGLLCAVLLVVAVKAVIFLVGVCL